MIIIQKYISIICLVLIVILSVILFFTVKSKNSIETKWKNAMESYKYYSEQYSTLNNSNRALKLTIAQINYSADSIVQELNNTRKELKIKDSKIKSLQYISSTFNKSDTIIYKDTILNNSAAVIDTIISDEWHSIRLEMKYPSSIIVTPEFKSIKHIIVSSKKETVNPPKKFFLLRWFQKKHTVLNIDIIEKNPYIQNKTTRYIEMVKD